MRAKPPNAASKKSIPLIVWIWLGLLAFWLAVTAVSARYPALAHPASASNAGALTSYFNDHEHFFKAGEIENFNRLLADFDKETSTQIAVSVHGSAPRGAVEEFTIATAERSRLGQKGQDNGAILFLFMADKSARFEVGYGLEGVLTDFKTKQILDQQLKPAFARGEYVDGLNSSLQATLATVRREYQAVRAPGWFTFAARRVISAAMRVQREAWPFLSAMNIGERLLASFFASLLGVGVAGGVVSVARLAVLFLRGAGKLIQGKPISTDVGKIDAAAMFDTLKLIVVFAVLLGGGVVIAGDGGFGGAGAASRW